MALWSQFKHSTTEPLRSRRFLVIRPISKLLPYLQLSSSDELNVVNGVMVEFNLAYGAIHSSLTACSMNQAEHFSAENQKIHRTY